ncbi:hypothetical protein H6P81_017782 [Aristolochia fimbriata]|uniref:CST complex subunit STN1 n=1 Tax=Aristolochia fimbriata TaxID=158543 RepID=A0AAV7DZW3_ARIFI|nr:hypothetical protein H6P81_017782 [Aristolochia fimbriata]
MLLMKWCCKLNGRSGIVEVLLGVLDLAHFSHLSGQESKIETVAESKIETVAANSGSGKESERRAKIKKSYQGLRLREEWQRRSRTRIYITARICPLERWRVETPNLCLRCCGQSLIFTSFHFSKSWRNICVHQCVTGKSVHVLSLFLKKKDASNHMGSWAGCESLYIEMVIFLLKMDPQQSSHMKLFASDVLSLRVKQCPFRAPCLFLNGRPVSKLEIVGIVVSCERKERFLKFVVDDGSGCIPCILWLNQLQSTYFARVNPSDVELIASAATDHASKIQLGILVRIRGKISIYRDMLQMIVADVLVERDPNAETLHWLECIRLAKNCYHRS